MAHPHAAALRATSCLGFGPMGMAARALVARGGGPIDGRGLGRARCGAGVRSGERKSLLLVYYLNTSSEL